MTPVLRMYGVVTTGREDVLKILRGLSLWLPCMKGKAHNCPKSEFAYFVQDEQYARISEMRIPVNFKRHGDHPTPYILKQRRTNSSSVCNVSSS